MPHLPTGRRSPVLPLILVPVLVSAADSADQALDKALSELPTPAAAEPATIHDHDHGGDHPHPAPSLRLIDLSLALLGAAGGSTARDRQLEQLQGGAHDPRRRGFTFQTAELSLSGAVDPYFDGEAHLAVTPGHVELEEAYIRTTSLPNGLELKGGYYLTEFGRINATHAHAWSWIDQPLIASRIFGGEGWRASGARVGWLIPLPIYARLIVGAQNANDPQMYGLMGGDPEEDVPTTVGGRPQGRAAETAKSRDLAWSARLESVVDLADSAIGLGVSGLVGPNLADGTTTVLGADLRWKWSGGGTGRFLRFDLEGIARRYGADAGAVSSQDMAVTIDLDGGAITDRGFVASLEYGLDEHWSAGLRGEYASGSGESALVKADRVELDRQADFRRDGRWRFSPLISWRPTEFSRLRLQYNHDRYEHGDGAGRDHTVWFGVDVLLGAHPPHGW